MKNYENIYILKGSMTENDAMEEIEKIKKYFKEVKIFKRKNDVNGYLGNKRLAYEIRGEKTGYYYITYFEGAGQNVLEIERNLRINENVIKFMTIRVD